MATELYSKSSFSPKRGLLGIFENEENLKKACRLMREQRFEKFDAFTPYPVHGLEHEMGLKRSFIPWVTFGAGLTGFLLGTGLQVWTSVVDWPINVGGKPMASLPAFVPVSFELTVLIGGLATAGALFMACGLPDVKRRILAPEFSCHKFGVFIPASDRGYKEDTVRGLLQQAGAAEIRSVEG